MRDRLSIILKRFKGFVTVWLLAGLAAVVLSLVSLAGATTSRLASTLGPRLSGQVTVAIWGRGLESTDAAVARAAELLGAQRGVKRAIVLEPDESDALVGRLFADHPLPHGEPRLIAASEASSGMPAAPALKRLFQANGLAATIDDHRGAFGPLETRMLLGAGFAVGLSGVVCATLFAVCLVRGLRARDRSRFHFDLMARLGATPGYLGARLGGRMASVALAGAIFGAACANLGALTSTVRLSLLQSLGLPAVIDVQPLDVRWTLIWIPILAGFAGSGGALGAWLSARRRERRG